MKNLFAFAALAMLAWSATPAAATQNGNDLLTQCESGNSNVNFCLGYISGVKQALTWWEITDDTMCFSDVPKQVTNGQGMDVVVRYLRAHPETRHDLAVYLVAYAFQEAWPCK